MSDVAEIYPAIRIALDMPDRATFKRLRSDTDWGMPDDALIDAALSASLYGAIALTPSGTVGMVRTVGDGALNVYIQDLVVARTHRGQGIGRALVQAIIKQLQQHVPLSATVGLMAADGQSEFYKQFGLIPRPGPGFGPGMQSQLSDLTV
ncbi:MAG: GNAT family N-acetyltransferase [Litorimonas sp.]